MQDDPIVEAVRKVRQEHAGRFDDDLDAIFEDLKTQERRSGRSFVSYPARPARTVESAPATQEHPGSSVPPSGSDSG